MYITTPIYYVNDKPHIGHAYTNVISDIIARYYLLRNEQVLFATGTDEHGQKIEKSAQARQKSPQEFCDEISNNFRMLANSLNLSNNIFIRTTQPEHITAVTYFWNELFNRGEIYLAKYQGWYAINEETFYQSDELYKTEQGQYITPFGNVVEWVEQESYFFKLSKWQQPLLDFYNSHQDFIIPEAYYNEVKAFVAGGLKDISISRMNCRWGIPVPQDHNHVIYVWVDALVNYLTATNYPNEGYSSVWPADVHVIGKDILRFHAVYWIAMLLAAGIALPKQILVHGWWKVDNQKMSKSLGNVVDPNDLIQLYGLDPVRYYLVRQFVLGSDGNFTQSSIIETINTDLANTLGNLFSRVVSLLVKNFQGFVVVDNSNMAKPNWLKEVQDFSAEYDYLMQKYQLYHVLEKLHHFAKLGNKYINDTEPWKQSDQKLIAEILANVLQLVLALAIYLSPFIPDATKKILDVLNVPINQRYVCNIAQSLTDKQIKMPDVIFPRIKAL